MPSDGFGASVRLEDQLLAVERGHRVHCMLELSAPPMPTMEPRRPLHLALVLDRSRSMHGDKLETAKACAAYLARRLAPTDRLAIVTYDNEVRLELALTEVGHGQLALEHALELIVPGGMTNLSGGWLKGVEQLRAAPTGGPKKVLLLTDGLANRGITDPEALVAMARSAGDEGVGTTTIGFGGDFDEELLTRIADVAAGNAYFAATPEEAPAIFAQEFEGLTALVAQNISVEVRPSADVELLGVLNEYPVVPVDGGLQAQLGDAYAEEQRRVVFELSVPRLGTLGVASVAEVVVRYVSIGEPIEAHELRVLVVVNAVSADDAAQAAPDAGVVEEIVVLKSARAQRDAREHAERGEFDAARKLLAEAAEDLRRVAPGSSRADELLAQADETTGFAGSMSSAAFDPIAKKQLRYSEWQRNRGRPRK